MEKIIAGKHTQYKSTDAITLSASKINLFFTCPLQYYFRYLYLWDNKPIQINWPGAGFGEAMHKILEDVSKQLVDKVSPHKIIVEHAANCQWTKYYEKWMKDRIKDKTLRKPKSYNHKRTIEAGEKFAKIMSQFLIDYSNGFTDLKPESEFTIQYDYIENVLLNGFVDLTLFFNEYSKIFDFKTTKYPEKFFFVNWENDTQSLIYLYNHLKTYKQLPKSFSYLVLSHDNKIIFLKEIILQNDLSTQKELFELLTEQVKTVVEYTRNPNINIAIPEEEKCMWCDYKQWCTKRYMTSVQKAALKIIKK